MKKKRDNKSLITKGVVALLCVFFVVGFIWGFNKVMNMEGTMVPSVIIPSASTLPETVEEALKYVNSAIETAYEKKPSFSGRDSFSIGNISISTDGTYELLNTIKHIKDNLEDGLEETCKKSETDFGENLSGKLLVPTLSPDEIGEFVCAHIYYKCPACDKTSDEPQEGCSSCDSDAPFDKKYRTHIYYDCPSCGMESEEPTEMCDKCGYEQPYNMQYRDEYTITFVLSGTGEELLDNQAFVKLFGLRTKEEIADLCKDEFDDMLEIAAVNSECNYALIEISVNRFTDELISMTYIKNTDVSIGVEFTGGYSALGNVNVGFNVVEKDRYSFTWPALELSSDKLPIAPGDTDNLVATLVCTDPTAMTISWKSSDESIVTVDNEGYLKAAKTPGEATITASFEFQGKVYSDVCTVTVKTSVEELKLSKRRLTLNEGESYTLTAKVSPKKSTVQSVKWYSADETVATVDSSGKVTAISPGIADIYALSDDGYYKSTCEVTVE